MLPGVERLPLATYRKIEQYAVHGGIVIATRHLPSTAPGLLKAESESQQIKEISERLFRDKGAVGHFVEDENQLGAIAASYLKPDISFSPKAPEVGFIHRKLSGGDLYFIANTSNKRVSVRAAFRQTAKYAEWWDAFTGRVLPVENADNIEVDLQAYESRLIFLTNTPISVNSRIPSNSSNAETAATPDPDAKVIDLSTDWNLHFSGVNRTIHIATLHSWSEEEPFKYYSGQVTYEKTIELPAHTSPEPSVVLDFGEGTTVEKPDPLPTLSLRAYLDGPVRDAAEVFVNGQRVGVVWHPPYTIDLSSVVKAGKNDLRIIVGNTAINSLAGRALPDYRLLNDHYGERFVPQGMENLQPLESGLVGGLRLRVTPRHGDAAPNGSN